MLSACTPHAALLWKFAVDLSIHSATYGEHHAVLPEPCSMVTVAGQSNVP